MYHFKETDLPTIQRYLSNQLQGEELATFEQRLGSDQDLREELEWYRALFHTLEDKEDQRLKDLLNSSTEQEEAPPPARKHLSLRNLSLAAGLLLILGILSWLWLSRPTVSVQDLFKAAPMALDDIAQDLVRTRTATRSGIGQDAQSIKAASIREAELIDSLYERGNYQEVLPLLANTPTTASTLFYRANCLIALGRNEAAISVLHEVETYTNDSYSNFAQWYLALAYYRADNKDLAQIYASKAADNPGIYLHDRERARQLMDQIKIEMSKKQSE